MTPFELVEPQSLAEAISLLDPDDPHVRPIAGGTALMLMMKAGVFKPTRLVSLRAIEKRHAGIAPGHDGELRIGAMTPLSALERSPTVQREFPVIARALRTLSNVRVRNVATLGGHLAHADPHMDLPPLLIALGTRIVVAGPSGEWSLDAENLFSGYYETTLARNELITEVRIPRQAPKRAAYLKCTTRSADDWPALGIAVALETDGERVREARVAISAACDKPTRLTAVEAALRDAGTGEAALRRAGDIAADETDVVPDARGSAAYKRELVRVYLARAVRQALASDSQNEAKR